MRPALKHLKKSDPVMARIIAGVGPFAMEYNEPTFETLVRSIVYQQLNGRAAATIFGRLKTALGKTGVTPVSILKLSVEKKRSFGLSGQKTVYIRELAKHTKQGTVVFESLPDLADADVIEHLTQVKGIGVWTAQMFLMFALRRHDILPVADLGIRTAVKKAYDLAELPKAPELEQMAAPWRPYASIACWYLWRSLDGTAAMKDEAANMKE